MARCVVPHDGESLSIGKSFAKFLTPKRADDAFFCLIESVVGIDRNQYATLKRVLRVTGAAIVGDLPLNFLTRQVDRTSNSLEFAVDSTKIRKLQEWIKEAGFDSSSRELLNGPFLHRGRHRHGKIVVHVVAGPPLFYVLTRPTSTFIIRD